MYRRPSNADDLIKIVRQDSEIGVGTCSYVDETQTDDELLELICYDWVNKAMRPMEPDEFLTEAKRCEALWQERANEIRSLEF